VLQVGALERHLDRQPIVTEIPSWKRGEVWALFLVALSLRLIAIVALGSHGDIEGQTGWSWGREPGALGESLFRDGTLSDPWGQGTGPTAWLTPVFPALVAICLKLFGGLTPGAAALLHVIHALVAAGTCLLLIEFGRVLGSPRAGRLAAWMFALYPASIWHAAHTVWDTTLIAAGLLGFLILVLRAGPGPGVGRSGKLGLAFGALLMINPAPVGILPFIALYLFPGGRGAEIARRAGAFLGAALLVCLPWMIRNALVIGTPALRSNLGVELHVGNNDAAQGRHEAGLHPSRGGEAIATGRWGRLRIRNRRARRPFDGSAPIRVGSSASCCGASRSSGWASHRWRTRASRTASNRRRTRSPGSSGCSTSRAAGSRSRPLSSSCAGRARGCSSEECCCSSPCRTISRTSPSDTGSLSTRSSCSWTLG